MKLFISSIFILISFHISGQVLESCLVYQKKGIFGFPKKVLTIKYNLNGKMVWESYTGYLESDGVSPIDITTTYVYNDTLLISESSRYFDGKDDEGFEGDSIKTIYFYNINGKLEKSESYSCENGGNWEQTSEIYFSYDSIGNKILYDATKIHYSSDNKYTWKYDEKNRVIECHSYNLERLNSTTIYEYFPNGFRFTETWFESNGSISSTFSPMITEIVMNEKGQVIEEIITNDYGKLFSRKTIEYNSRGKVSKTMHHNGMKGLDKDRIIHHYKYKYSKK